jgi:hypothetical protein
LSVKTGKARGSIKLRGLRPTGGAIEYGDKTD